MTVDLIEDTNANGQIDSGEAVLATQTTSGGAFDFTGLATCSYLVDITDTGRGVPAELSETIFMPMITDKADGSGLGLPIAQEIITRHGGSIQLHSSESGTTFSTILPLEPS